MLTERSKLRGTVTAVDEGAATAGVTLDLGGKRVVASIPVDAVGELGLRKGSDVVAIMAIIEVSDNVIPAPVLLNDVL
jgi:molybdopterin-binding protein